MNSRINKATAARILGIHPSTVAKMIAVGRLHPGKDGYLGSDEIKTLAAQRLIEFRPGRAKEGEPPVFACPTTSIDFEGRLELVVQTDALEAGVEGLRTADKLHLIARDSGGFLTGAWEIPFDRAQELVRNGGYLLGVVGGFVFEVVQVTALAARIPFRDRKVLAVTPVDEETRARFIGFVPKMQQRPHEVVLPAAA